MRSWIAASCSGMRTELSGAFEVAGRGGMGSGVVFSLTPMVGSVCEASDICVEMRVGGRAREGGLRTWRCSRALLLCVRSS